MSAAPSPRWRAGPFPSPPARRSMSTAACISGGCKRIKFQTVRFPTRLAPCVQADKAVGSSIMRRELAYPEFADPMVRPRYTGIPTFMRAPYREDLAGLDRGLIGGPFDGGVTNRTAAPHGPRGIRNRADPSRAASRRTRVRPHRLGR